MGGIVFPLWQRNKTRALAHLGATRGAKTAANPAGGSVPGGIRGSRQPPSVACQWRPGPFRGQGRACPHVPGPDASNPSQPSTPRPPKRRTFTVRLLPSGPDPVPASKAGRPPSGGVPATAGLRGRGFNGTCGGLHQTPVDTDRGSAAPLWACAKGSAHPPHLVPAYHRDANVATGASRATKGSLLRELARAARDRVPCVTTGGKGAGWCRPLALRSVSGRAVVPRRAVRLVPRRAPRWVPRLAVGWCLCAPSGWHHPRRRQSKYATAVPSSRKSISVWIRA
jgi:hypothetical protein